MPIMNSMIYIMINKNYSIPVIVDPVDVADGVLAEEEIEWSARRVHPNWAGGP